MQAQQQQPYQQQPEPQHYQQQQAGYYEQEVQEEAYAAETYQDPYQETGYAAEQQYDNGRYAEPAATFPEETYAEAVNGYYDEGMRAGLMEYAAGQVGTEDTYPTEEPYTEDPYMDHDHRIGAAPPVSHQGLTDHIPVPVDDYQPYNRQDQQQFGAGKRPGAPGRPGPGYGAQRPAGKGLLDSPPVSRAPVQARGGIQEVSPGQRYGDPYVQQQQVRGEGLLDRPGARNMMPGLLEPPVLAGHGRMDEPEMMPPVIPDVLQRDRR